MFFPETEKDFVAEIKKYLPASADTTKARLLPFINQVERNFLLPVLDKDLFDELQAYVKEPSSLSGSGEDGAMYNQLLALVRECDINLAFFTGFDLLNSRISETGFSRVETENFKGLYKYAEDNIRDYFRDTGYNLIDSILAFLEENIQYFPDWEDSTAYTVNKSAIFPSAKSFTEFVNIRNSRVTFLALQQYIRRVTDIDIKNLVGAAIMAKLNTELAKGSPAPEYVSLAAEIRKPLAFLATAELILNTGTLTDLGQYFQSWYSGAAGNTQKTPVNVKTMDSSYNYYKATGEQYLDSLRKWLLANSFPGYAGTAANPLSRDNDGKKTFWV